MNRLTKLIAFLPLVFVCSSHGETRNLRNLLHVHTSNQKEPPAPTLRHFASGKTKSGRDVAAILKTIKKGPFAPNLKGSHSTRRRPPAPQRSLLDEPSSEPPHEEPPAGDDGNNAGVIIGASVAGVAALAAVGGGGFYLYNRKVNGQAGQEPTSFFSETEEETSQDASGIA